MPPQQTPVYTPQSTPQPGPAGPNPASVESQATTPVYTQPAAPAAQVAQNPYQPQPQQPLPAYAQPPAQTKATSEEKRSLILGIAGIAIFIIGFLVGYAALAGALCGVLAVRYAKPTNYAPGLTTGIIALVLNVGLYALAVFIK